MYVNRVYRIWLPTLTILLSACTLGGGGGEPPDDVPTLTPTLIDPVNIQATQTSIVVPPLIQTPPPTIAEPTVEVVVTPEPTDGTPTSGTSGIHIVLQGQWIYEIARIYGITPANIIAANPAVQANPDLIVPNQSLVIPGGGIGVGTGTSADTGTAATPVATLVPAEQPTAGPPSLPVMSTAVYQGLLNEALPAIDLATCPAALAAVFQTAWAQGNVGPRLGCPTQGGVIVGGTWLEFGTDLRIMWVKELAEFHALSGSSFGQRWVFPDVSGLINASPQPAPTGVTIYVPEEGRFGWLFGANPEIVSVFATATGDETAFSGQYQTFANGAILFDGERSLVFFDDAGPWWYLAGS